MLSFLVFFFVGLVCFVLLVLFFLFSLLPAFLFPLNPEKLIEGLKSPETALLLPDILPLADPFGSTSDAVNGKNNSGHLLPSVLHGMSGPA